MSYHKAVRKKPLFKNIQSRTISSLNTKEDTKSRLSANTKNESLVPSNFSSSSFCWHESRQAKRSRLTEESKTQNGDRLFYQSPKKTAIAGSQDKKCFDDAVSEWYVGKNIEDLSDDSGNFSCVGVKNFVSGIQTHSFSACDESALQSCDYAFCEDVTEGPLSEQEVGFLQNESTSASSTANKTLNIINNSTENFWRSSTNELVNDSLCCGLADGDDLPCKSSHRPNNVVCSSALELDDNFFGLPSKVQAVLQQSRGIAKLYEWQETCLRLSCLKLRRNLIYSLPTSGGKTLVAEILIMKELLLNNKSAIFIVPFVAIVQEKVRDISPFAVELGFHVEEYAASKGSIPPKRRRKKQSVFIATIEKANAIINSFVETDRLDSLGLVVVDELHMLGDGSSRGATLEIALTKLLFKSAGTQIIGMSATLSNIKDLQMFLNAEVYSSDFRPVALTEYLKIGDTLYKINSNAVGVENIFTTSRKITHPENLVASLRARDPDHILALALEIIPKNSCLIFCATKKNCESVALMLSKSLPKSHLEVRAEERQHLLQAIRNTVNGVCRILRSTIPYGVAYHHSGLTMDERKLVEEAYSNGTLCLLCCTSTLAAGVNLPARRVILRSPYVGDKFLSRSQYKQMIGRAGRAGIDGSGESILVVQNEKDRTKVVGLLEGPVEKCISSLMCESGKGLRTLLLTLLGLKICVVESEISAFIRRTLYFVQEHRNEGFVLEKQIAFELKNLEKLGLITLKDKPNIVTTDLGRATLKGCVDVDEAPFVQKELKRALEGMALCDELHLLYLATPLDQVAIVRLNWMTYYQQVSRLSAAHQNASKFIGITEGFLHRKVAGEKCATTADEEFIQKRFYLTLMLYRLVKKFSIWNVADTFSVSRGFVQNLLTSASAFTALLVNFTKELDEFWPFQLLFEALLVRLSQTSSLELLPLMEIPGVKQARAKQLYKAGYHTLANLASADIDSLVRDIEYLPRRQARLIISSAKMLIQEKVEALREEADEIAGVSNGS